MSVEDSCPWVSPCSLGANHLPPNRCKNVTCQRAPVASGKPEAANVLPLKDRRSSADERVKPSED